VDFIDPRLFDIAWLCCTAAQQVVFSRDDGDLTRRNSC
jgi:hypothetical protein